MDTAVSDDNWGAQHHRISLSSYFDHELVFQTVLNLYCCVTGEHSKQRTVMDTSLSDIIEACTTLTTL